MIFDSHSHTSFSADSDMTAEDALKAARARGLGIVFTEHLDVDFPGELDFSFDPAAYWKQYEPLRGDNLHLGIEVGMQAGTAEASRAFVTRAPFDLVIGSVHLLRGIDIYEKECFEGREKDELYREYFRTMAEMIACHDFIDVLGHIDYIARTAPYENPELSYGAFADEIDAVLRTAVAQGVVLELNTRRLGSRRALKELAPIYARYHELGGRYVTLGSDAHGADAIGANFAAAEDFARAMGLSIVTFFARKMEFC
ncbi:MAG: histidinol-phosphatase HisJ family protein [Selenomonas sp.]|uniref:histidinol-phosphatase HisJ family protein n=1 Tax=uncultured Selenomonas sp. TaxID=159275 RepID=UPI0025F0518D|nr:histidinol-phosphatase HisJ family protein [uncultured Selenomonas sp.]MDY6349854.1 histidinol-phosphatase HisJ family protein [Selenomonas sp.]